MKELLTDVSMIFVPIAVASFIQYLINTKRRNRSKQVLMPFVALVYYVIVIALGLKIAWNIKAKIEEILGLIKQYGELAEIPSKLLNNIPESILNLVPADVLESLAAKGTEMLSAEQLSELPVDLSQLLPFDISIDSLSGLVALLNVLILAGYLIVKIAGTITSSLVFKKFRFKYLTDNFYEFDEEYSDWFLREKWVTIRSLFKWLTIVGSLLCAVALGVLVHIGAGAKLYTCFFPVIVQIINCEIFCFLNGYTKEEFAHDVVGDDSYSQKISNFYRIRAVLEKTFPREILSATTGSEYVSSQGVLDLLEQFDSSGDEYEDIVAEFFKLNETEEVYDADCIQATLSLMKGKNVVFFNPFYHDLGKYLALPFMNTLMAGKKCLILAGRSSTREDLKGWISEMLYDYGKIRSLWRVKDLSDKDPDCEVGVLNFSQLYDLAVLETNKEFLKDVGFVFMSEPSLIVNTGQIGVAILAEQMQNLGAEPVYCISDRLVDGLVDTVSHLLQSEITEVVAPPVSRNIHTSMAWNADGDFLRQKLFGKQTQYLGNGLELAAVSVKNQVPEVTWFAETKVPVRDIKWIVGQYYPVLCRYMNLPVQQQSIYDKIKFVSCMWSAPEKKEQFVIAEDEFNNIFSTMRTFLSRGKTQTFVNVLAENYLLRDYMRCNPQMFATNPNAIPSLVPDYAKTERNTLIKLLMLMAYRPMTEDEILKEFQLTGIETTDVLSTLGILLSKYTKANDSIFEIKSLRNDYDGTSMDAKNIFKIIPEKFEEFFGDTLKIAYYVCEDEKREDDYLDAKLIGHVTQTILSGQFVTYEGKYYMVKHISPVSGVVLRRASNLFNGRKYYKQLRKYVFEPQKAENVLSCKTVMDVEITQFMADFHVETSGYLELNSNNDLRSARLVDLSKDPSVSVFNRNYHNKAVLRIKLPESTDRVRFTCCMLLSEVLKSVFPNAWQYLAVTTVIPDDITGMLNYTIYDIDGDIDGEYIYIIEDSEIDLGLLDIVEKNMIPLIEIVTDFLSWHFEKMREPAAKDPQVHTVEFPETDRAKKKKRNSLISRIGQIMGGKKEKRVDIKDVDKVEKETEKQIEKSKLEEQKKDTVTEGTVAENTGAEKPGTENSVQETVPESELLEIEKQTDPDVFAVDGTDIFEEQSNLDDDLYFEDQFREMGIIPLEKSRYQEECYLKFGFEEIDGRIKLEEVMKYLTVRGFSNNSMTKARKRNVTQDTLIDFEAVNHCDFCGMPLTGVSFEKLSDGRIRCNDCSHTAITSVEEFKKIFYQTLQMMEGFYGIAYKVPISVATADAHKIAKGYGSVYTPSTDVAARVLGYASKRNGVFSLYVENGSPRLATIETMAHELTHIWQYINWNESEIKKAYPEPEQRDIVYEGMSMWATVQYFYLMGEESYAILKEAEYERRQDIYGIGFRMYREKYPLIKDSSLVQYSPFKLFPPL